MAITGINNSSYTSYYATNNKNSAKKADGEKDSASTKESNVATSTVELKTSTAGVTRTEQIKTGFNNVNDYSKYLQGKYGYMNTGTTSMQGVPTTVSVSSAFLQKCMNDPEKAKYLEENLAAIPDCVKSLVNFTKTMPGSPVCTYATYIIGDDGNITIMSGCTNDPDGKIAKENAERKAKEKKEAAEKLEKKRAEKKAEEQKAVERRMADKAGRAEKEYSITMQGTDVKSMTQSLVSKWNFSYTVGKASLSGFDVKA